MQIDDPKFINAAQEYLVKRVGVSGASTQLFLHLLEEEAFAGFGKLLEEGKAEDADSMAVITAYMKREACLREKAILLADLLGLSDEEERACFIVEEITQRERFIPLEKVDVKQLKRYLKKVRQGMPEEQALSELGFDRNLSKFETIHESFDWDD